MSHRELHRAVATATGETVEAIERLGFQAVSDAPLVLDWEGTGPVRLDEVLAEEDGRFRVDALPSHDEEFDFEPHDWSAPVR